MNAGAPTAAPRGSPPLWQQVVDVCAVLAAVEQGRSGRAALEDQPGTHPAAVQAMAFLAWRHWGLAQELVRLLVPRSPPPPVRRLLALGLLLLAPSALVGGAPAQAHHAVVDQVVEAGKRRRATAGGVGLLNACLRRFLREQDALIARALQQDPARWNHPLWWIQTLQAQRPETWPTSLQANQLAAPTQLRVNLRRISHEACLAAIHAVDPLASASGTACITLGRHLAVHRLPGFAEGWFSVQDAHAQWAAPLLLQACPAPQPGERLKVLDACAAPGGKTSHLLELADLDLLALDIDAGRLARIQQNLDRLGLQATLRVADAAEPDSWRQATGSMRGFDAVLLDAPCSASGIVRRHPDIRWLRRPEDLPQLAAQQAKLLHRLWPLVRPGGVLLYATCSVFQQEGEWQILDFLLRRPDAQRLPAPGQLWPGGPGESPQGGDGFYYALLRKADANTP